ncbi:hypothetical protein [Stenotrophomonas sp. NY11291]|uniref:hypothetical protein n=1 Tax=Stenotrophomonas sp. NY11291 TaxID=2939415 RepID=UPI00200C6B29|nr:hypothetical protein [Stenotrophomonas sp. NY11291]UQA21839.1 hypothetical protein M1L61_18995 [Stenotrophomonas sp. NY11291]
MAKAETKHPRREEWQRFDEALASPWAGGVEVLADGHRLQIAVRQIKPLKFAVLVYVDGQIKQEFCNAGNAIGLKFYRPRTVCGYTRADQARMQKDWGKRWTKAQVKKATVVVNDPRWGSPSALRRHLVKTCTEIHLVRIGWPEKAEAAE